MIEAIAILWQILENFPELLSALAAIEKAWESYQDEEKRDKEAALLKAALIKAKDSHDTSELTSLVNNIITGQPLSDNN